MIILNAGDHTYSKIGFDERTLANLLQTPVSKIENGLTRSLIFDAIYHEMLDLKLTPQDTFSFLFDNLGDENQEEILRNGLSSATNIVRKYLPKQIALTSTKKMFSLIVSMLSGTKSDKSNEVKDILLEKIHLFMMIPIEAEIVEGWL